MERQDQMREQNVNLHLHLQHLSEGDDFLNEWIFVESRPIAPGEHNVCPCGQMGLKEHFMIENKINGNRTFVGSECIDNIDPKAKEVNYYIRRLLYQGLQGTYRGMTRNDLVLFSSTIQFVNLSFTLFHQIINYFLFKLILCILLSIQFCIEFFFLSFLLSKFF